MADLKRNFAEIKEGLKIREFYCMIIYLIVTGFLVPSFSSFGYFFMLDVVGVSKFSYSMLTVLGYGCLLIGSQLFNNYFKEQEFRKLILGESLITLLMAPLSFIFILRINLEWGIPDMAMIIFTDTISSIFGQCLVFLPMSIIFAKICPKHIEATTFALLAGVSNFRGTIASWIGAWINETFVGVTETDLSKYWILVTISHVCTFLPLAFIWLIPTRKQIEDL